MDIIVRSKKLQFEKSNLFIQIYKKETGIEYIKIIQNISDDKKSSILINPNNLDAIIETLINFKEDIALNQEIKNTSEIKEEDQTKIIKSFLKGVTLKDLKLQFGYETHAMSAMLKKNEIEIIEGIKINSENNYPKNKRKTKRK